jgi:hypothetical protein
VRADGGEVELLADDDRPGGWLLLLDRVRQSYVSLDDPTYLEFPYIQVLAGAIEALPSGAVDAVHVGGGGATLPRWLAAVRPGSSQIVFESNAELLRIVQTRLPVTTGSRIEFRVADGRSGLAGLADDSADVIVVDAFSGGRVPGELGTMEFFADASRVLRSTGILLLNTTGAMDSDYLRRLVAAVVTSFPEVLLYNESGDVVGNVVIGAALSGGLPIEAVVAADGPMGSPIVLSGPAVSAFVGDAAPLADASTLRSPVPSEETWRVGGY